jgi:uncharacterized membrane protein
MRIQTQIDISAPPEAVWETIADPSRYLHFMAGITRWEVASPERPRGLGARYRMLLRAGSAEVGGLIEIVEFDPARDMAWSSVTGLDQRGRWRLRERPGGRTRVEFRLAYGVAGSGIFGWLAEQLAAPGVRGNMQQSTRQLKRYVEHEQLRAQASERRGTRVGAA